MQLLGLFIIARGLRWVFWGLGGGVQVGKRYTSSYGGGGGGGGIFSWKQFSTKKCSWGLKTQKKIGGGGGGGGVFFHTNFFFKNVPGVLKRMQKIIYFSGGGGFWGAWGAPRPHPGVARGRKTIHFFLWPWHVTG